MKALAGEFGVKQELENRFLELSPYPLNTFGVLVGPEQGGGTSIQARTRSWSTGKRYPEMGVSIGGVGGFRLMLMPAVSELQIRQEDKIVARVPFAWKSGTWVHLQLESSGVVAGNWMIAGRAWHEGESAPAEPTIRHHFTTEPTTGRAAIWAIPYSEKPIQFDDLLIETRPTPE